MLSSFRIMSPTSFVYGESVDASNFIQLDDLECHFQPLNVTLQVPTHGDLLYHWVLRDGPMGCAFYEKQPKGQAFSKRNSSQPECVCVFCNHTQKQSLCCLVLCCVAPSASQYLEGKRHDECQPSPADLWTQHASSARWSTEDPFWFSIILHIVGRAASRICRVLLILGASPVAQW